MLLHTKFPGNRSAGSAKIFEGFLPYMGEVVRLAKYNLYWYIGCLIYQSNWSRPFSLVVMMPDY